MTKKSPSRMNHQGGNGNGRPFIDLNQLAQSRPGLSVETKIYLTPELRYDGTLKLRYPPAKNDTIFLGGFFVVNGSDEQEGFLPFVVQEFSQKVNCHNLDITYIAILAVAPDAINEPINWPQFIEALGFKQSS